jgi:hypothetical protein
VSERRKLAAILVSDVVGYSWPLKVLALVFGDQSKLLAALCVAKDLVRGRAYS